MKKGYFIIILNLLNILNATAQIDPHFSQYYAYPAYLNPSLTCNINEDFSAKAIHREQYIAGSSPFTTTGAALDFSSGKHFGYGISILNQVASGGGYHNLSANLGLSYNVYLDPTHILTTGFQAGILNRYIDPSGFQFGNQYNPLLGFDPNIFSNEVFNSYKSLDFDINAGLMYIDVTPNQNWNPFIGGSIFHLNNPKDAFLATSQNQTIFPRYVINGGVRIKASETIDITPHFIFMQQGYAREITGGILANIYIVPSVSMMAGATYRVNDAIVPTLGLEYNNFIFGLSYDVSTSQYKTSANYQGGFELSLSFTHKKEEAVPHLACPRL